MDQKTNRYIKYAVGETLLVIIGILIVVVSCPKVVFYYFEVLVEII